MITKKFLLFVLKYKIIYINFYSQQPHIKTSYMDTMKLWFGVTVVGYGYKLCTCCK